jgi:succinylglutamate desuccinylase
MKLNIENKLPENFFNLRPNQLHKLWGAPTLIHLEGEKKQPLFISTLLHGNETSGFIALQQLLKDIKLPRSLILFFGNLEAAEKGVRHLPDQPDFNRIWSGEDSREKLLAQEVTNIAKGADIWASIDIHNNTGNNPYYACINSLEIPYLSLASLFSKSVVYFNEPHQVQSISFSKFCASITLECGVSGDKVGVEYLVDYLKEILSLDSLEDIQNPMEDIQLYQTVARIKIDPKAHVDFKFSPSSKSDISFIKDLDHLNFKDHAPGETIAYINSPKAIRVINDKDEDVTEKFFKVERGQLKFKTHCTPSMLTKNIEIAKDDSLGYLMEEHQFYA